MATEKNMTLSDFAAKLAADNADTALRPVVKVDAVFACCTRKLEWCSKETGEVIKSQGLLLAGRKKDGTFFEIPVFVENREVYDILLDLVADGSLATGDILHVKKYDLGEREYFNKDGEKMIAKHSYRWDIRTDTKVFFAWNPEETK